MYIVSLHRWHTIEARAALIMHQLYRRKQVKRTIKNAKDLWLEKMCAEAEQMDAFQAWE